MKDIPNCLIVGGIFSHPFLSPEISSESHIFDNIYSTNPQNGLFTKLINYLYLFI